MYNSPVPNQRREGRQVVALWMDEKFLAALDAARQGRGEDRSTFIRKAIAEELTRLEIPFNAEEVFAPDRTGKEKQSPRKKAAR